MQIDALTHSAIRPLKAVPASEEGQLADARALRDAYRDFVGKTFFGEMLKSMRSTVGKPAYFHGGHAEEVFRSQLDQQLSDSMTKASAHQIADPGFRLQFPKQAAMLEAAEKREAGLDDLAGLRRI